MTTPQPPASQTPQNPTQAEAAVAAERQPQIIRPILLGSPFGVPPALIQQQFQLWHGPLPSPEAVKKYEEMLPGVFNRLVTMAEELQAAQIKTAIDAQTFTRRDMRRGQWLGFVTSGAALGGAAFCTYMGSPLVAVAFLSVPVMAVAKSFIESVRQPREQPIAPGSNPPPSSPPSKTS